MVIWEVIWISIFSLFYYAPLLPLPQGKNKEKRKKQKGHPFVYANVLSGSMSFPCTHCWAVMVYILIYFLPRVRFSTSFIWILIVYHGYLSQGILTNETRCLRCETVTARDETFFDLSLDIEQNSSITSCLKNFSSTETLNAEDKFFCDKCCR